MRIVYYYLTENFQVRLLLIYKKGKQDNLTSNQKKMLRQLNERWS